jgi:hypothetical protein
MVEPFPSRCSDTSLTERWIVTQSFNRLGFIIVSQTASTGAWMLILT